MRYVGCYEPNAPWPSSSSGQLAVTSAGVAEANHNRMVAESEAIKARVEKIVDMSCASWRASAKACACFSASAVLALLPLGPWSLFSLVPLVAGIWLEGRAFDWQTKLLARAGAILQREPPAPVYGYPNPGAQRVEFFTFEPPHDEEE